MDILIKDNQKFLNQLHIILDAIVTTIAYVLAWYVRFRTGLIPLETGVGVLPAQTYMMALLFLIPGYLLLYSVFNLYASKRISKHTDEFIHIIEANIVGLLLFLAILYVLDFKDFSRKMLGLFIGFNIVLDGLYRFCVKLFLQNVRKRGYNMKYILLVGYSKAALEFIDRICMNPEWGYVVRGILDDHAERGIDYRGVKVLGTVDNLSIILPESKLDEIAITLSLKDYGRLESIVALCEKSGVHTKFIPDYNSVIPSKPYTEDLLGLPVINIRHVPLSSGINQAIKRCVDILGSLFCLLVFSPVMLFEVIAVKCSGPGPIIFKQERVGLHNKPFMMYKFRTMVQQTEEDERGGWTTKGDPRVTKIGHFLRNTSLDELPQLVNVLKGDMSLVGPRPERPQYVEKFKEEIPRYMVKHQVRPGMTGWAQVNGYRGDTSIRGRIDCDIYYIENWTLGFDLKILVMTIFTGFVNKNAC